MNAPKPEAADPSSDRLERASHRVPLRAGLLTLDFENGGLRAIRLGSIEVLRGIYAAVRDRNWNTIAGTLENLKIESDDDSFMIEFRSRHLADPIDFVWHGRIVGGASGGLVFSMSGEVRSAFLTNRVGFCVLHPIRECAGRTCWIETVSGSSLEGCFPERVAPHQPFQEMRAITHEVAPGLAAEVRLEGETFEMEDQRNWTDASFKTYCRPLAWPFPFELKPGDRVEQTVRLRLRPLVLDRPKRLTIGPLQEHRLPSIGLGIGDPGRPWSARDIERLRALRLGHLRIDLPLADAHMQARLADGWSRAEAVGGVPLEIALTLSEDAERELDALSRAFEAVRPAVARWLVFHEREKATSERWERLARARLEPLAPGVPIGAGTNAYFAELNRGYPPVPTVDFVCYSINPQVHAFDDASLFETLDAQQATLTSAWMLAEKRPVVLSPITLKPRFNPNATGTEPEPAAGELPPSVDPRQRTLQNAAWTLGSLANWADAASLPSTAGRAVPPAAVTYFEAVGWRGVLEAEDGPPLPERFPSRAGEVFPVYHVFADLAAFAGARACRIDDAPEELAALALVRDGMLRVLIANLRPRRQSVAVSGLGESGQVRLLDERYLEAARTTAEVFRDRRGDALATPNGRCELTLGPYALVRIDTQRPQDARPQADSREAAP